MNLTAARGLKLAGWALILLSTLGCARGCTSSRPPIHINPNMDSQEKVQAQEASRFFYDGSAMRMPIEGTVARDGLTVIDNRRLAVAPDPHMGDVAFHTGKDAAGAFLAVLPVREDDALLARGAERFRIYCTPCHGAKGNGKGILTERGGVPVPSFFDDRLVQMAPGEIFDTVTNGKGLMGSYRYPVPAGDRWAIIAYIRWMQREQGSSSLALAAPAGAER